jgi:hypothetical protein
MPPRFPWTHPESSAHLDGDIGERASGDGRHVLAESIPICLGTGF